MNYPLISEYIESIKYAEDNFATLTNLRPVLDENGNPIMSSGNFAVVFKMKDEQTRKMYAVKCFLREQEGRDEAYRMISEELEFVNSTYLTPIKYLKRELFVNTSSSTETEFPVLLMDWVEGMTLDKYIRNHLNDKYELSMLAYQFSRLAMWLMPQPFAHGDLKPDNIIVKNDGTLVLVDYDGMFVPSMKGQKARELGSPDFRHPQRTENDFDENIDDFSLATIAMQLAAIALEPGLLAVQDSDTLLLTEQDHRDLVNSANHLRLRALLHNADFERLYSLYHLAHAQLTLSNVSFRAFLLPKPEKRAEVLEFSTEVTNDDRGNGIKDEFGALYSPDGLRLLRGISISSYHIRQGTKVICNYAFVQCGKLASITIPNSVTQIGNYAFEWCGGLSSINIPESVTQIGNSAFGGCESLSSITIPNSVTQIGKNPFSYSGVRRIECNSSLFETDENALYTKGKKVIISYFNKNASIFTIPNSVTQIGDKAFFWRWDLDSIIIPDSVTHIGGSAFEGCGSLTSINIPNSVTHIGNRAFSGCSSLSSINIPNSVTQIGINPFSYGVRRIECNSSLFETDENALYTKGKKVIISYFNKNASIFNIPESVTQIGNAAFSGCSSLTSITIPDSVTQIGDHAFYLCSSLTSINIPNSVTQIGNAAFRDCDNLSSITIPRGSRSKFEQMLPSELHKKLKEQ